MRASLLGLATPIVSIALLAYFGWLYSRTGMWDASRTVGNGQYSFTHAELMVMRAGVWLQALGMFVGLFGRPRLITAIVLSSAGVLSLWFVATLV